VAAQSFDREMVIEKFEKIKSGQRISVTDMKDIQANSVSGKKAP